MFNSDYDLTSIHQPSCSVKFLFSATDCHYTRCNKLMFPFSLASCVVTCRMQSVKTGAESIQWVFIEVKTVTMWQRRFCSAVVSTEAGGINREDKAKSARSEWWHLLVPGFRLVSRLLLWFLTCCKQLSGCLFDPRSSAVLQLCSECQTPPHFTSSVSRGPLSHLWEFDQIPASSCWPDYYWSANPCFVHPVW